MKSLPDKEEVGSMHPHSLRIWEEIVSSMDQYTNDSPKSKFYLPEELLAPVSLAAITFTQILYTPIPSRKSAKGSRLFDLFYLAMTCGVHIYLKEQRITHGYYPYVVQTDPNILREVRNSVGKTLTNGVTVVAPASEIMQIVVEELKSDVYMKHFLVKNREFNVEKFHNLLPAAVMWGYHTAKELVIFEQ